jgi:hypothetical protein
MYHVHSLNDKPQATQEDVEVIKLCGHGISELPMPPSNAKDSYPRTCKFGL